MRFGSIILFFIGGLLVQTTLLNLLSISGINANLLLCMTIVLVPISEQPLGTIGIAAVTGLVFDTCFSQYIGITSIGLAAVGFALHYLSNILNIHNLKLVLMVTIISTIAFNAITWTFYEVLNGPYNLLHVLSLQPFYILYNLAAAGIMYYFLMKAGRKNE